MFGAATSRRLRSERTQGFTLMEMLIVVAIIAVLVAIAIPVFNGQLERGRQATDAANARSAYAAAVTQWMSDGQSGEATYVFTGASAVEKSKAGSVDGYGLSAIDVNSSENSFTPQLPFAISGTPKDKYLVAQVAADGTVTMHWGASVGGGVIRTPEGNWYGILAEDKRNKKAAYEAELAKDNAARVQQDQDTLNALASYFNGMSVDEARSILGNQYDKMARGSARLFAYQVDGGDSYSIRLTIDGATNNADYLAGIGYDARVYNTQTKDPTGASGYAPGTYNYADTFLFSSNAVIGERACDHNVNMRFTEKDGVITGVKLTVGGTDLASTV